MPKPPPTGWTFIAIQEHQDDPVCDACTNHLTPGDGVYVRGRRIACTRRCASKIDRRGRS